MKIVVRPGCRAGRYLVRVGTLKPHWWGWWRLMLQRLPVSLLK